MNKNRQSLLALILGGLVPNYAAQAQNAPVILQVDVENFVSYMEDTADITKYATLPGVTTAAPPNNFFAVVNIGDIMAVNGQPAKGTFTTNFRRIDLTTASTPGGAIADTGRIYSGVISFEFLTSDGAMVGSIMTAGLGGAGTPPPGSAPGQSQGNNTIVGGTGAYVGARGTQGQIVAGQFGNARNASIMEDPANRRINGGGTVRQVLEVIPMTVPQVLADANGPMITHGDFSPVTAAKPAKAGEVLIMKASGLGPTVPGIVPGQLFPSDVTQTVNSPIAVSVNGQSAQVINAIGWPGLVDTYRVDFQVPAGTPSGTAALQLTAAWIPGPAVNIPVQ